MSLAKRWRSWSGRGIAQQSDPLQKRLRVTLGISLFAIAVLVASVPFDWLTAPRWMLAEDALGVVGFAAIIVMIRRGWTLLPRVLTILLANLIVFSNVVLLGPESGAQLVLFAAVAAPFALFDLTEWVPVSSGVALSVACLVLGEADALAPLRSTSPNYDPAAYRGYSFVVALSGLLFALVRTSLANFHAERALRETRESAIYAGKMAALGEMSAGLAHEVHNPLAAIVLQVGRLRNAADAPDVDRALLRATAERIDGTAQRIRRIVDALRSFSRDTRGDPPKVEALRDLVNATLEMCRERFRNHGVALQVAPIADDVVVQCRAGEIEQIILNLLSNAHDAVVGKPGAWVRIDVAAEEREVLLAVVDSGPGIPPDVASRIMQPFFTTKAQGKGTGLGLSVSKGLAEATGGSLELDGHSPTTRFVLRLPRAKTAAG